MVNNTTSRGPYKKLGYLQKLVNYNQRKRHGDVTVVANRTGYSTTHVSDVLSGKEWNGRILNAAYDRARGRVVNAG